VTTTAGPTAGFGLILAVPRWGPRLRRHPGPQVGGACRRVHSGTRPSSA